jgi:hypothetical protein
MTVPMPVICQERGCKWFRGWDGETEKPVCMAFPLGIPEEVLSGENKHDKEIPKDGGYRFAGKEKGA